MVGNAVMIGSRLDTLGRIGLVAAALAASAPFWILGRTADPSTQAYQDAKGSWIPKAIMNENATPFWIAALVLGVTGFLLIGLDRFLDRRRKVAVNRARHT